MVWVYWVYLALWERIYLQEAVISIQCLENNQGPTKISDDSCSFTQDIHHYI